MTKTVVVVGAGFAGLTLAYYLKREGFLVHVIERQGRAGGLLQTLRTEFGPVETGANALLSNRAVERMFADLELTFAERLPERKRRYIWRGDGPTRWPLDFGSTARLAWRGLRLFAGDRGLRPRAGESISSWGDRFGGDQFTDDLLTPALQGIYAGDPDRLSAPLILGGLTKTRNRRGRYRGSVAPAGGMGQLTKALAKHLARAGVKITLEQKFECPEFITHPTVIATPAWAAADILKATRPELARELGRCESLPLVSHTAFFHESAGDPRGFGCLFPRAESFHHLGVLFNSCVFAERATPGLRSETWIAGGAGRDDIVAHEDQRLLDHLLEDRARVTGRRDQPVHHVLTRWPRAIPHYTVEWERRLAHLDVKPPLYLHGNYLGALGLTRVHVRSRWLARRIKENHG